MQEIAVKVSLCKPVPYGSEDPQCVLEILNLDKMIDTKIPKNILNKLKKEVDDAVIISRTTDSNQVKFSNNKVSITQTWVNNSIAIFVAKDKEIVNYDFSDKLEAGINKTLEVGAKRTSGLLEASEAEYLLLTSNNVEAIDKSSLVHFSVRSFFDNEASGHITNSSRILKNFHIEKSCQEASEIAVQSKNPQIRKKGAFDIIFSPLASAPLLDRIGDATSSFNVDARLSFLVDKLNHNIADENIVLRDDATIKNCIGSTKFDSEGVPTQNNIIIDKGILKTYLHNSSTAKKFNVETTANAGLIAPQPWNLVLESIYPLSKEKLFKEIKNGLYVTNIWYTRFQNQETGEFSTIPRDAIFVIKNGEINGCVKGIRISDSMLRILQNIVLTANDPKQIRSWEAEIPCVLPHILVRNVNITTSTS